MYKNIAIDRINFLKKSYLSFHNYLTVKQHTDMSLITSKIIQSSIGLLSCWIKRIQTNYKQITL